MTSLSVFEGIVRATSQFKFKGEEGDVELVMAVHPFDERNIHPSIVKASLKLFNDGHYSQAVFEAFKYIEIYIKKLSGIKEGGSKLMMAAFIETNPKIALNDLVTASDIDEQMGFRFVFSGVMSAIRNPRAHDILTDPIHRCLDYLTLASVLLRRTEERKKPQP